MQPQVMYPFPQMTGENDVRNQPQSLQALRETATYASSGPTELHNPNATVSMAVGTDPESPPEFGRTMKMTNVAMPHLKHDNLYSSARGGLGFATTGTGTVGVGLPEGTVQIPPKSSEEAAIRELQSENGALREAFRRLCAHICQQSGTMDLEENVWGGVSNAAMLCRICEEAERALLPLLKPLDEANGCGAEGGGQEGEPLFKAAQKIRAAWKIAYERLGRRPKRKEPEIKLEKQKVEEKKKVGVIAFSPGGSLHMIPSDDAPPPEYEEEEEEEPPPMRRTSSVRTGERSVGLPVICPPSPRDDTTFHLQTENEKTQSILSDTGSHHNRLQARGQSPTENTK
uniref:Uncharacterized protein n=1 Tax=Chromera velia CCMP2878 TaxID=1169474 RepID=A0A0K6S9Z9_9ALVE|eukprot:Cvel_8850.t2-p1 / transcript=Cvel_8850.t2 / gene=Cvel_8850 / organism=Chromera_velia_CCMP2878 / gene_product=hypothetical protein / transcript_product=hypothetical protein / location=Cvel_scaffold497:52122-59930(+) / protein_length=342 / sequence_SO=supercontig / SO=protein_coding / is_pseudo=false